MKSFKKFEKLGNNRSSEEVHCNVIFETNGHKILLVNTLFFSIHTESSSSLRVMTSTLKASLLGTGKASRRPDYPKSVPASGAHPPKESCCGHKGTKTLLTSRQGKAYS